MKKSSGKLQEKTNNKIINTKFKTNKKQTGRMWIEQRNDRGNSLKIKGFLEEIKFNSSEISKLKHYHLGQK